jgi:hypothetical protein
MKDCARLLEQLDKKSIFGSNVIYPMCPTSDIGVEVIASVDNDHP